MATSESDLLVTASSIGVYRDGRWLVRFASAKVMREQLVHVVGGNGSGKTTFAKALLGLVAINEGSVSRSPGLVIGYVPQRLAINRWMPLNLRRMLSLSRKTTTANIDDALDAVGLAGLGDPPVHALSGGEFQRLLLARTLLLEPDMLVLDEPGQGVDAAGKKLLYGLIDSIREKKGCGVLMVTHDPQHVIFSGEDRIILDTRNYRDGS